MIKRIFFYALLLGALIGLAGCNSTIDPNPLLGQGFDSEVQKAFMKTAEAIKTANARATGTPGGDFSRAKIAQVGFLPDGGLLVVVQLPFAPGGEYFALAGGQDFACKLPQSEPDRLYCQGPVLEKEQNILQVYQSGDAEPMFALPFRVPGPEVTLNPPPE